MFRIFWWYKTILIIKDSRAFWSDARHSVIDPSVRITWSIGPTAVCRDGTFRYRRQNAQHDPIVITVSRTRYNNKPGAEIGGAAETANAYYLIFYLVFFPLSVFFYPPTSSLSRNTKRFPCTPSVRDNGYPSGAAAATAPVSS